MMIEGNPENFRMLRKNRPFLITIGKAACLEGETEVKFTKDAKAVAGVLDYMSKAFINQWHRRKETKKTVKVPCSTMQAMLDEHNVTHVDFFSLDVEGAELIVVRTIDFSKTSIDVMMVEMSHFDTAKNQQVRDVLVKNGGMCRARVPGLKLSEVFVSQKFKHTCTSG